MKNNGRSVNKYLRSLTTNNPGILIFKYDCLDIKAEKCKGSGICTYKIYDKDGDEEWLSVNRW